MNDPGQTLRPHLQPGEKVLWSGRPASAPLAHSYRKYSWLGLHIFMIPIFIFMMMYDINNGPSEILRLPARFLVISVFGVILMIWPQWKARRAAGIAYAVTDRRILIAERDKTRSLRPDALWAILRRERDMRLSDLTFGEDASRTAAHPRSWHTSEYDHNLSYRPGFFGIQDIKGAEAAVQWLLQRNAQAPTQPAR